MKRKILFILLFAVCIYANAQIVVKIIDGDTYKVLLNGKIQTIRIMNVDAPELTQNFGVAAKDSIIKLLLDATISIQTYKTDLYGRLLVSATFNGMSLDSLLIAKGWVWFYSVYSQRMDLKNIENAAKHNCLGLWNCTQPVPP